MFTFLRLPTLCCLLFIAGFMTAPVTPSCLHDELFDFETTVQKDCFTAIPPAPGSVSLSREPTKVKHLEQSLRWNPRGPSKLQLKSSDFTVPHEWLPRGGVKVWFYKEASSPGKTLEVEFKHSTTLVGTFQMNLDFKGWRGIWVRFTECNVLGKNIYKKSVIIDEVNFVLSDTDVIYMDLLGFEKGVGKQSRDKVVPPIGGVDLYDAKNTFQRTYHWSQQAIPDPPKNIEKEKVKSLEHIGSRLRNWYCDETKTSPHFPKDSYLEKRWNSLLKSADKAHKEYDKLIVNGGKIVGPPLFCRDCRYGNKYSAADKTRKFGFVMEKILLPLAVEYYLRSRPNEVKDVALSQLANLTSGDKGKKKAAYATIAGRNKGMKKLLENHLNSWPKPVKQDQLEKAITRLNFDRLSKINKLLDFVKDQGFADGSSLGSLDHEMNKDGAGFMHALFVLNNTLRLPSNKKRLQELIKTAKWYNDFGEIYQTPAFDIVGTTADRMITLFLYRLMIVLVMPSDTSGDVKAKLRDMDALVRWFDNALAVNEGLAGVIKPDFTGYHHKAFYGSAYVPQALDTAALVYYLLGGTEFALAGSSVHNIRRALETLRVIAVKSSTPNSVNGRFPHYYNKVLLKAVLQGYAYISVSYPNKVSSVVPKGIHVTDLSGPEMFLRLYNDPDAVKYLENGTPNSAAKYYPNTLGSLDIMEAVKLAADTRGISAESSPEGHWSKNFAALSVHRRKDWAVTVKGFNHLLWDFENAKDENIYGMFGSHGALLVANSEAHLEVHDVDHGWDWAKVPGATTIAIGTPTVDELNLGKARFYNPRSLAGGVTFKGTSKLKNGIFGMDFEQPKYYVKNWRKDIKFYFKKSVFFFENLLVCLGSNIDAENTKGKAVQTTLFQDRLLDGVSTSFITVNGAKKNYSPTFPATTPSSGNSYTTLTDAKGNFYFIPDQPDPSKSILKVHVQDQDSKTDDGGTTTSLRYATAWLEHDTFPANYEYSVLVPTDTYHAPLTDLATVQDTAGKEVYKVLQNNENAHIVQFLNSPESWTPLSHSVTGYVLFSAAPALPKDGPVEAVSEGNCLIMAEQTGDSVFLSISSPDINLPIKADPLKQSDDVEKEELYHASSIERQIQVKLRTPVLDSIVYAQTHGKPDCYKPNVWVLPDGKTVRFLNLKNGFSVEVKLTLK